MTITSISAYLPLPDLVKILAVALAVAVIAPSSVSLAIAGVDRRQAGSPVVGNSLIAIAASILFALVGLGLYALVNR